MQNALICLERWSDSFMLFLNPYAFPFKFIELFWQLQAVTQQLSIRYITVVLFICTLYKLYIYVSKVRYVQLRTLMLCYDILYTEETPDRYKISKCNVQGLNNLKGEGIRTHRYQEQELLKDARCVIQNRDSTKYMYTNRRIVATIVATRIDHAQSNS